MNVKRLVSSVGGTGGGGRQTANIEITVLALTQSTRVRRLYRRARCGACRRSIFDSPPQIDDSGIRTNQNIVVLSAPEITGFHVVSAPGVSDKIGNIGVEAFPLERIVNRREVIRDIRETGIVKRRVRRKWIVVDIPARAVQYGLINVTDARGCAPA